MSWLIKDNILHVHVCIWGGVTDDVTHVDIAILVWLSE